MRRAWHSPFAAMTLPVDEAADRRIEALRALQATERVQPIDRVTFRRIDGWPVRDGAASEEDG